MRFLDILFALVLSLCAASVPAAQPADLFDFWLGDWQLSWTNADGTPGQGRNRVTKSEGVIEERFDGRPGSPLIGTSVSAYDKTVGRWRQTWVDNMGGYLDFMGGKEGDTFVFARSFERAGKKVMQRMVFSDIKPQSFTWDWQKSDDGGATWQSTWKLNYTRVPAAR